MVSGRSIAGLLIAVTVAATLFMPIATSVTDQTGTVEVTEETAFASIDDDVSLTGYDILTDSESVEYYDEGTEEWVSATSGTDYEIDYDGGQIDVLETGDISDGDELRVSYDYEATDGMTETVMNLIPMFLALLILVSLAGPIMDEM